MTALFQLLKGGRVHPGDPGPGQDRSAKGEAAPLKKISADGLGYEPA